MARIRTWTQAGRWNQLLLLLFSHSVVSKSCNSMDCRPPGSSVHKIAQARILKWLIPFSKVSSQLKDRTQVSCFAGRFFITELPGKPMLKSDH